MSTGKPPEPDKPALLELRHTSVGTSYFNTVSPGGGYFCLNCGKGLSL
jgi:hypothetical protein